jgi:amino acid transporter
MNETVKATRLVTPRPVGEVRLKRAVLGFSGPVAQSLSIGPVLSIGLFTYLVAGAAGAAAPFAILVVGLGFLALAAMLARYARKWAGTGTVYELIARTHGRNWGVLAAGAYFIPTVATALIPLLTGLLFQSLCEQSFGFDPGWWTGGVVSSVAVFILNYRGIKIATSALLVLTGLSVAGFGVFAIAILIKSGQSAASVSLFNPTGHYAGDVFKGILFAVLIFAGFESAAAVGEEAKDPGRSVPRAMFIGVGSCCVFLVFVTYALTIGFGASHVAAAWGSNPSAIFSLADRYVGSPFGTLLTAGVLLDCIAVQIASSNTFARGYFSLARDGLLPPPLAQVSPRYGTPRGGLVLSLCSGLALIAFAARLASPYDAFELTAVAYAVTVVPIYIGMAFGAIKVGGGGARRPGRLVVAAVLSVIAAAAPALALYGTFVPFPTGFTRDGIWLAVSLWAIVGCWFAIIKLTRPDRISMAGEHAVEVGAESR